MDTVQQWAQLGVAVSIVVWFFTKGLPEHKKAVIELSAARDSDSREFRALIQKLADQHSADIRSLEASFQAAVDKVTASSERNMHEVSERTEKLIDRLLTESNANVTRLVAALSLESHPQHEQ